MILPYVEQHGLFREWKLDLNYYQQSDSARQTAVPLYFCPARRGPEDGLSIGGDVPSQQPGAPHYPGALGDYAGSYGGDVDGVYAYRGAFSLDTYGVRFMQITDGLSNTALVGDKALAKSSFGKPSLDTSLYNGDNISSFVRAGKIEPYQNSGPTFGSWHIGIVVMAMCDGSVRFIPKRIDQQVVARLCQRDDGQPVGDF